MSAENVCRATFSWVLVFMNYCSYSFEASQSSIPLPCDDIPSPNFLRSDPKIAPCGVSFSASFVKDLEKSASACPNCEQIHRNYYPNELLGRVMEGVLMCRRREVW